MKALFNRNIGIDYSGAETPTSSFKGLKKKVLIFEKLRPSQVAVLSPYKKDNSSLAGTDTLNGIPVVEDIDAWNRGEGILFSTVRSFKGLEADAVVIMDVMEPGSKLNFTRTDFYVACSRAKHLLAVIEREEGVSGIGK